MVVLTPTIQCNDSSSAYYSMYMKAKWNARHDAITTFFRYEYQLIQQMKVILFPCTCMNLITLFHLKHFFFLLLFFLFLSLHILPSISNKLRFVSLDLSYHAWNWWWIAINFTIFFSLSVVLCTAAAFILLNLFHCNWNHPLISR